MAYNNYNNRGNNGYKKNYNNNNRYNGNGYNNGFNNGYRPQNDNRPVGFDARKYKKPDFPITDFNGKTYMISGNFSTAFAAKFIKYLDIAKEFENIDESDVDKYPKAFEFFKNVVLDIINLNVDGIVCTMEDIDSGFNDYFVLQGIFNYIAGMLDIKPQEMNKPTIK